MRNEEDTRGSVTERGGETCEGAREGCSGDEIH